MKLFVKKLESVSIEINHRDQMDSHPRILKELACLLAEPSTIISNNSVRTASLQNMWKMANITAIFKKGVPQGSILGPLLFLIFINDIVKHIGGSIRLFADDTSLYIIVDLPEDAARILNADLQTISQWANAWLVTFNASKTLSMIFSRKSNPVHHPSLFMNGTIIEETTRHKYLGLTFSSTCTWTDHVNTISEKAWTRLNFLRALKFRVSRKSLEKIYIYLTYVPYLSIVTQYGTTALLIQRNSWKQSILRLLE